MRTILFASLIALAAALAACKGDPAKPAPPAATNPAAAPTTDDDSGAHLAERQLELARAKQAQLEAHKAAASAEATASARAAQLDSLEKQVDHLEQTIDQASALLAAAKSDEDRKKASMLLDASHKRMAELNKQLQLLRTSAAPSR